MRAVPTAGGTRKPAERPPDGTMPAHPRIATDGGSPANEGHRPSRTYTYVVTDIDNTLFDWLRYWYHSFAPFLRALSAQSGLAEGELVTAIRGVFERYGTMEYVFLVQAVQPLVERARGMDPAVFYAPAIRAFKKGGEGLLVPFPGVVSTLRELKQRGVKLAAFTDSPSFHARVRCRALGLDGLLDLLVSQRDHVPPGLSPRRSGAPSRYNLLHTRHVELEPGLRKPNRDALLAVLDHLGAEPDEVLYVGDSLIRDISMAEKTGVAAAYAAYGDVRAGPEFDFLMRLAPQLTPSIGSEKYAGSAKLVLQREFGELLGLLF